MNNWSYQDAFSRNLGLINPEEQEILRRSRVAIVGQGGVGGIHLVTLARLGIGKFTIADPDTFEAANFNRQYGAFVSSLGKSKVEVMANIAKDINPEIDVKVFNGRITPENVDEFFEGADLFVDGIDFFEIEIRRLLFKKAAEKNIFGVTAGPIGFGTAWLVFDPKGMSFDQYFDFTNTPKSTENISAFLAGIAPKATQRSYMDMKYVDIKAHRGPSSVLACQLCAGVVAAEALKILLRRGAIKPAPYYHQFDAYKGKLIEGKLWGGNKNPLQRLKRVYLMKYFLDKK